MAATLWKYSVREVQRRPGRTLLTLAGIVIGVATVVAVTATIRATRQSYRAMFDEVGGKASLEVVAPGQGGFDPRPVYEVIESIKGVRGAVGLIQTRAGMVGAWGIAPVLVLGVDPEADLVMRTRELDRGTDIVKQDGILLETKFAEQHSLTLGDRVTLGAEQGLTILPVVGLLKASGPALFNGGAIVVMRLSSAQKLFGMPGKVNSVQIVLEEGGSSERMSETINKRLTGGLQAQAPLARAGLAQGSLMSTEQALSALSVVSLVGGGFVILNAFLMNLGERRRQLAILRALGTTRRQVTRLLLHEALLLGIAGTVLGMMAGTGLARGMVKMHEKILGITLPPLQIGLEPFVLALFFGPGLALVATIIPAWQAGQRSPLEAMRPRRSTPEAGEARSSWPLRIGLLSVAMCASFLLGALNSWWPSEVNSLLLAPTMMLFLFGCVLVLPSILTPLMALTRRLLAPLFGMEGGIALRQLERRHTRTALTVGVLFIGVIVTIGFGSSLLNNIHDIDRWYREAIPADILVRGSMPDAGTLWASPIPLRYGEELNERLDGKAEVGRINFVQVTVKGHPAILIAREFPSHRSLAMALVEGDETEVREGLARGEIVVGTALVHRTGLGKGDELPLMTLEGEKKLRIVGVTKEYTVGGMALYANWETTNRLMHLQSINAFEVYANAGRTEEVENIVRAYCGEKKLLAQSNAQLRAFVDGVVAGVEGFLWVLIALEFVVAALGVVNTLTMNVTEQTRELGVLRAIGLKRGQVRKMVTAQAAALGILSVLPGVPAGIALAWLMNAATYPFSGHRVDFQLRPGFVATCAVLTLIVALLTSLLPARRASRLRIIEALHYE